MYSVRLRNDEFHSMAKAGPTGLSARHGRSSSCATKAAQRPTPQRYGFLTIPQVEVWATLQSIRSDLAYVVEKRPFHVTNDGKGQAVTELLA